MTKETTSSRLLGKGKLKKFSELATFGNVLQVPYSLVEAGPFALRGHWHENYFHNNQPITLELGCGRGEYTVGLARLCPKGNFIGVDIKGARMWSGARQALDERLSNVAFLRTNIEMIDRFFDRDEITAIWLTFSDPQMRNARKRLTSTYFLERYRHFLVDNGVIHLKTDSTFLFTYTTAMLRLNALTIDVMTDNLYDEATQSDSLPPTDKEALNIQTYYERMWLDRGITIKYVSFRLPQEGLLREPTLNIPFDDYRSRQH